MKLEDRLKKSLDACTPAAPSFNPHQQKDDIEVEVLPDIREIIFDNATRMKVMRLVHQSLELQRAEADAKKQREPITKQIKELIGENSFMIDDIRVKTYSTTRTSLSKEKLLEAGVSPQTIQRCTTSTVSLALKITALDEPED